MTEPTDGAASRALNDAANIRMCQSEMFNRAHRMHCSDGLSSRAHAIMPNNIGPSGHINLGRVYESEPWVPISLQNTRFSGLPDTREDKLAWWGGRDVPHSILKLQGGGDGASWWIGGGATILGAEGSTAILEFAGQRLSRAPVDSNGHVLFFTNKPVLPIGYAHIGAWEVCINCPGLTGPALTELGVGPELRTDRPTLDHRDPEAWTKHLSKRRVICTVPVGVVGQDWMPGRLEGRARLLGANNEFMLMDDADVGLRFSR